MLLHADVGRKGEKERRMEWRLKKSRKGGKKQESQ